MGDLSEALARAAVAAIVDTAPTIEADPKAVRYLIVEIELSGGKPTAARARVEPRCNVNRLLGLGGKAK